MNKSKKNIFNKTVILGICTILLFALVVGFTMAYYVYQRSFSGIIRLSRGVAVTFSDTVNTTATANQFSFIKYNEDVANNITSATEKSSFIVTDADLDSEFYLVNPILTAKQSSGEGIYLRARIEYKSTAEGTPVLTLAQMSDVFGTQAPIAFNSNWLVDTVADGENTWFYYVGQSRSTWTSISAQTSDLAALSKDEQLPFFTVETSTAGTSYVNLVLSKIITDVPAVSGFTISLIVEAVEGTANVQTYFNFD